MLVAQTFLLKCFGFMPLYTDKFRHQNVRARLASLTTSLIAVSLLLGTLYSSCQQCASFINGFLKSTVSDQHDEPDTVLKVMQLMPFPIINSRGLAVLFLFFIKRRQWPTVMQDFHAFCSRTLCPPFVTNKTLKKCTIIGILLCIVTVLLHGTWETTEWVAYLKTARNTTVQSSKFVTAAVVSTLFSSLPFLLSQQVFLCLLILSMVLGEALTALARVIQTEIVTYDIVNHRLTPATGKEIAGTLLKVKLWEFHHMQMLLFFQSISQFFSLILFVAHGMDFLVVLGFVANIVLNNRSDLMSYVYLVGSSIIFLSYGTLFLGPLITVHERSCKLGLSLHCLSFSVEQYLTTPFENNVNLYAPGVRLIKRLKQFELVCEKRTLLFHGMDLIYYNRRFVAWTSTFLLSFMVVARQFFASERGAK
ncbi:hypothetical protein BV898_12212 [Hypsibius exemplaris]|uniref:Gustatory receptor n=1 Tax=Hypsibius exemplaris TaxID=2072580 RepID=A0A1W0WED2_HYPEX|nr:hypothetical protein BV898_12212 [Hypsibius exemplaris]